MAMKHASVARALAFIASFVLLVSSLAAVGVAKSGEPDLGKSPDRRLVEYTVQIPAGDYHIPAILAVPKRGGPKAAHPGVLLVHGFASHKDEVGDMYKRLARTLALEGYASLRFDFAGSGDSSQPFVENTFDGMVADTRTALDYFAALSSIDEDRIGLVGFSLGAPIGATVAGSDTRVKAFATWSGSITNGDEMFEGFIDAYYDEACPDSSVVVDLGWRVVELSCEWFDTMLASAARDAIGEYAGPILAIAGTEDPGPASRSRQIAQDAATLDFTMRILEGADHIYHVLTPDQTLAEMVLKLTGEWFAEKL